MIDKVIKNSREFSFLIEAIILLFFGVIFILAIFKFSYKWLYNNYYIRHVKSVISSTVQKSKPETEVQFINAFYSSLDKNSSNLATYLSPSYKSTLLNTYQSDNYYKDIISSLNVSSLPNKLILYENVGSYYIGYLSYNNLNIYINIYTTKVGNTFEILNITLSEG